MNSPRRRPGFVLLAAFAASACIQHRLDVDIRTDVRADGSCTRRIEYRLERIGRDGKRRGGPVAGPKTDADADPLRAFFRFPAREPWTVHDEVLGNGVHVVSAEATLPSVNDVDWDYWRQRAPAARPARNYVSFALSTSRPAAVYEYAETFRDPASPMAAARRLAELAKDKDAAFAEAFARALEDEQLPRGPLRRAYREVFAAPLAQWIARLAARPTFGPYERQELERLFSEGPFADFKLAIQGLFPGRDPKGLDEATEAAFETVGEPLEKEMAAAGLPLTLAVGSDPAQLEIRFRATLIMPAPITRANTCYSGDTATWEFDQDDLYAGAFPMWAKAQAN